MTPIENKIAIVTGANRGIGKAIVNALLEKGVAKVYACARNIDSLSVFTDTRVVAKKLDITHFNDIKSLAKETTDVNLLINNAGINTVGNLLETNIEDIPNDFNVNVLGTVNVIKSIYPQIEKNGGGNIVNIVSICAFASMPSLGGYSISKAALYSASQALRTDLKKKNITLNCAHPGPVDTDMNEGLDIKMASPQDIANAILDGVIADQEEIYPDPMSQDVFNLWQKDPKLLEQDFSKY